MYPVMNQQLQPAALYPNQIQIDYYPPVYQYPYQYTAPAGYIDAQGYAAQGIWPQHAAYAVQPALVQQCQQLQPAQTMIPTLKLQFGGNAHYQQDRYLGGAVGVAQQGAHAKAIGYQFGGESASGQPSQKAKCAAQVQSAQSQMKRVIKKSGSSRAADKLRPLTRHQSKGQGETPRASSGDISRRETRARLSSADCSQDQLPQAQALPHETSQVGKRKRIHARNTIKNISNQIISYIASVEVKQFFVRELEEKSLQAKEKLYRQFVEYVNKFKRRVFTIQDFYDKFWTNLDEQRGSKLHALFSKMIRKISWHYLQARAISRILTSKQMKDLRYHMKMRRYLFRRLEMMGSVVDLTPDMSDDYESEAH